MASDQIIKPALGDKTYRMADKTLEDKDGNFLPNTMGNIVNFKVGYDKDFKGTKFMKDDDVHKLHVVHAEYLEKIGTGKIQKDK